ncbi:hypothetical protein D9M71_374850 [compost metagenome]
MHAVGERFERQVAAVAASEQGVDLRRIAEDVALAHQHPVTIANGCQRGLGILDPGDVHQPGQLREELLLAGQVMVKGVMHQPEHIQPADGLYRVHRRAFTAQRALFETQRFDEPEYPVIAQDRRQLTQRRAQA